MSGGMKRTVGPAKAKLKKHMEEVKVTLGQPQENGEAQTYHAGKEKFLKMNVKQMQGAIESVDKLNEKSLQLTGNRDNLSAKEDGKAYEEMEANGERFICLLEKGKEAVEVLKVL